MGKRANLFNQKEITNEEKKQVVIKDMVRKNNFLEDMLLIVVLTKIGMKYMVGANHFLLDVASSGLYQDRHEVQFEKQFFSGHVTDSGLQQDNQEVYSLYKSFCSERC